MASANFPCLNFLLLSFFFFGSLSRIVSLLFFAAALSRRKRASTPTHAITTLTKGHDGARVDRPHGGGSGARSRRDGRRRRRRRVRPCDGRHDCGRARGDAPGVRHAKGRHGGVWSQRGRCEGRALRERRRCGALNSLSLGPRSRERERGFERLGGNFFFRLFFFYFFFSLSSLVFSLSPCFSRLSRLRDDALRPAAGRSGGGAFAPAAAQ